MSLTAPFVGHSGGRLATVLADPARRAKDQQLPNLSVWLLRRRRGTHHADYPVQFWSAWRFPEAGLAREEVEQQRVDLVWGVQLKPVARAVWALVSPGARHVFGGVGHLHLGEGDVAGAPDAHGGCLHGWELRRWPGPGFGRDVGPVPVEGWCERTVGFQVGDHTVGVGVACPGAEVGPVVLGQPAFGDAGELEQQHVPRFLALG